MKFFTPDLLQRGDSLEDDVADAASEEWERALGRYRRRWRAIRSALPKAAQRFHDERICLHDAQVLSVARDEDRLLILLEPEPPARTTVVLTFLLDGDPVIDPEALPDRGARTFVTWMYEEWDVDRQKRCTFEVLLTNGWSIKLRFRDFQYQIAERLFPAPRAADTPVPAAAVSQPA
jgi:hypothetical protein